MRCEAPYQFLCYRNLPKANWQPAFLLHLLDMSSTLAPNFLRHYDQIVRAYVRSRPALAGLPQRLSNSGGKNGHLRLGMERGHYMWWQTRSPRLPLRRQS